MSPLHYLGIPTKLDLGEGNRSFDLKLKDDKGELLVVGSSVLQDYLLPKGNDFFLKNQF